MTSAASCTPARPSTSALTCNSVTESTYAWLAHHRQRRGRRHRSIVSGRARGRGRQPRDAAHRTGTENYSLHVLRQLLAHDQRQRVSAVPQPALPDGLLPARSAHSRRADPAAAPVDAARPVARDAVQSAGRAVRPQPRPAAGDARRDRSWWSTTSGTASFRARTRVAEWLYLEWAIRRHVRVATRLLTISEASKRDLVRLYGADPARIDVAYPAVEARFKPRHRRRDRARARAVTAWRALRAAPGHDQAAQEPAAADPRLRPGAPASRYAARPGRHDDLRRASAVEHAIAATGIANRVRRLAYVPDADLPALFSGAACVAIVSLYEGFGMPALEALACGAPLVASNRGLAARDRRATRPSSSIRSTCGSIASGLERAGRDDALRADAARARPACARPSFDWATAARVTRRALEQASRPGADTPPPSPPRSAAS